MHVYIVSSCSVIILHLFSLQYSECWLRGVSNIVQKYNQYLNIININTVSEESGWVGEGQAIFRLSQQAGSFIETRFLKVVWNPVCHKIRRLLRDTSSCFIFRSW